MEGYRVKGQRRGKTVDTFLAFTDVEPYLAECSRREAKIPRPYSAIEALDLISEHAL
jgi:hypothetical protein